MTPTLHQKRFRKREDRTKFILSLFEEELKTSILDVGCYEAPLRELVPDAEYFGIDIVGKPDLVCNLEETEKLPVEDNSYDTVGCFEVLEHLDSFHRVFRDLFRAARKDVLVSLPNCWCSARSPLTRGTGAIAHYDLPQEKPIDRHKWFICSTQITQFFEEFAQSNSKVTLKSLVAVENERPALVRKIRELRYGREAYLNRYAHTIIGHFSIDQ